MRMLTILLILASASLAAHAAGPEPWHGKLLQEDVQRPGGIDWVSRDVIGLHHAYSEQGNVERGFVQVEWIDTATRQVSLTCKGSTIASMLAAASTEAAEVTAECFGIKYRLMVVDAKAARFPRVAGNLPTTK